MFRLQIEYDAVDFFGSISKTTTSAPATKDKAKKAVKGLKLNSSFSLSIIGKGKCDWFHWESFNDYLAGNVTHTHFEGTNRTPDAKMKVASVKKYVLNILEEDKTCV